ncbi:MAG: hypothetical protein HYY06_03685 [Deltaproteobacteria bacterium]|nr:hypothetical protein [Deltaproteobacteria bacterium]
MSSTRVIGVLCAVLAGTGCGDDDDDAVHAEASIGSEGGSLTSADGRATLAIPAGALAEDRDFTIDAEGEEPPMELVGVSYSFGPQGSFDELAHVALGYDGLASPTAPRELRVAYSADNVTWSCIAHAQRDDESLWAMTNHLSIFAVVKLTCESHADCPAPERCVDDRCGIPCRDDRDCPGPMACDDGVCAWDSCENGEGCDDLETDRQCTAGQGEGPGICYFPCSAPEGEACGDNDRQFACTSGGDCSLVEPCSDDGYCNDIEAGKICYEGWCIVPEWGCDCGEADCPCTG